MAAFSWKNLKPSLIWDYFSQICEIPHCSGQVGLLSEYICLLADQNKISYWKDDSGNIILQKNATSINSDVPGVVFQAHIDMDYQVSDDVRIVPVKKGDWLSGKECCIGADNGIGVACILALFFSKNIIHGPLEAILTHRDSQGNSSLSGFACNVLQGKYFINLDGVEQNSFYVGCSGGIEVIIEKEYEMMDFPKDYCMLEISVKGLKGGNSGLEIANPHGNALKILNRLIWNLSKIYQLNISSMNGGEGVFQIPSCSTALIAVSRKQTEDLACALHHFREVIEDEFQGSEPNLKIKLEMKNVDGKVMKTEEQKKLLNALYACPHGVLRWNPVSQENVEVSSNLGKIEFSEGKLMIQTSQRSCRNSLKVDGANQIRCIFENLDCSVTLSGYFDGWVPQWNSRLLELCRMEYENCFRKSPQEKIVHAGLECCNLPQKYPEMELISIGANIESTGLITEKVSIKSVEKLWKFIEKILLKISLKEGL